MLFILTVINMYIYVCVCVCRGGRARVHKNKNSDTVVLKHSLPGGEFDNFNLKAETACKNFVYKMFEIACFLKC